MFKYRLVDDNNSLLISRFINNNNNNRKELIIPSSEQNKKVKYIGIASFCDETKLIKVAFSQYIEEIGRKAFKNSYLQEVILNHIIREIRDEAFQNNYFLKNINLQDTEIVNLGKFVFRSCIRLEEMIFPKTIKYVGYGLFYDCERLKKVDVGSLLALPEKIFFKCVSLEKVYLNNVNFIGKYAFCGCVKLKEIYIGKDVEFINNTAFRKKINSNENLNITIVCEEGSYAKRFAKENKIKFRVNEKKENKNG